MHVQVEWVGQPVGLVVAHSRAVAERAAALVKVRVVDRGGLVCLVNLCVKQGFCEPHSDSNGTSCR